MYALVIVSIAAGLALLLLFILAGRRGGQRPPGKGARLAITNCPLCGSNMEGERLYSKLTEYRDGRKMLEIRGCGHCRNSAGRVKRLCPSCKSQLGPEEFIVASYDDSRDVIKVSVKGCRRCYSARINRKS